MNYNEATPDYCYGCKSLAHRIELSEAQRDELLAALQFAIEAIESEHPDVLHGAALQARAAIAKAKGESYE